MVYCHSFDIGVVFSLSGANAQALFLLLFCGYAEFSLDM